MSKLIPKFNLADLTEDEVQQILADAFLNLDPLIHKKITWNPFLDFPPLLEDKPELWFAHVASRPEYFSFLCREILNVHLPPIQGVVLRTLWNHKFPMLIASRGFSKSFLMAVYCFIRMILLPRRQIVVVGAAFRQSKIIMEYMLQIWDNAPILRDMCRGSNQGLFKESDRWDFRVGNSLTKALPVGNGEKIRGQRANDIICDELKSVNREIFETVISGFAAVSSSPVEAIKSKATEKLAKALKIEFIKEENTRKDNQSIMSGTCDYAFGHFAEYWRTWKSIIESRGEHKALEQVFKGKDIPKDFNWRDYCILRIPYDLIPEGQLDTAQIARFRGSMLPETFNLEFGAIFVKDSSGFFKRSLIESCVASPENSIQIPEHGTVIYNPVIRGNHNCRYVFALDPASEVDKFAIVIIELHNNHRRIVYCWTTDKKEFKDKYASGLVKESDFYGYCARKVRDLMKVFPCDAIALDKQGGGVAVLEALHDKDKLLAGELPIWPIQDPDNPQDTDGEVGHHLVHVINFADANWTREANHGLKKDFMDKSCLFPYVDAVEYALAMGEDEMNNRLYDTLEDCIFDLNELKDELSTIVLTITPAGRERWDTPETKIPGQKKGRMRKDRYSALVMANMVARTLQRLSPRHEYTSHAGWSHDTTNLDFSGPAHIGPSWAVGALANLYDE